MKKNEIWNFLKTEYQITTQKLISDFGIEYKTATVKDLETILSTMSEINKPVDMEKDIDFEDSFFGYAIDVKIENSFSTINHEEVEKSQEQGKIYPNEIKVEKTYYEQRLEELNKLYPLNSNLGQERKKLENRTLLPSTSEFNISKSVQNITPKKVAITKQTSTEKTQILQERLTITESDNLIAEIGYICLNDGVHYKGRDAVLVVKHCLSRRKDTLGNDLPPYYNQPIYCLFGQSRVKRDSPVMVPISVKDKNGNWVDRMVKSDTKPDTAASVRDYMNNGKIESAGYKQAQKVQSLTLYPEKFYLNDPRKTLHTKKTLNKEQELRHIIYRSNEIESQNVTVVRSQAFKSNGNFREFKTPGGYVGGTKKTKSKISSGGKSNNNVSVQVFDKGTKFTLEKLGVVQLVLNTNSGIIDLIDYKTGKIIIRVGEITQDEKKVYDWKFYKDLGKLKPILKNKIESLIRPKQADSKGNINLVQTQILDGLKQQQIQKVTEERFGHYISERKIKRIKVKAYKFLRTLVNQESHPLYKHLKSENWEEVLNIMTVLNLVGE